MAYSAARALEPMTVEQFLAFCEALPEGEKWELHDGRPVMMVGGTIAHAIIADNWARALHEPARRRNCRPVTGFLVQANESSLFEPDVAIFCDPIDPESRVSGEPRAVFEVLSPSTMRFDRTLKFERYRAMPSVEQLVFIYQEQIRIESYLRRGEEWMDDPIILTATLASLSVPNVGASIPIVDIYDGLDHLLRG
jgi:Uma2 family endonuclease